MRIDVVQDLTCPKCGAGEMHPNGNHVLIRAFKVHDRGHWWSQCLVCAGYYDDNLETRQPTDKIGNPLPETGYNPKLGWF